jgi:hypothetical protein
MNNSWQLFGGKVKKAGSAIVRYGTGDVKLLLDATAEGPDNPDMASSKAISSEWKEYRCNPQF